MKRLFTCLSFLLLATTASAMQAPNTAQELVVHYSHPQKIGTNPFDPSVDEFSMDALIDSEKEPIGTIKYYTAPHQETGTIFEFDVNKNYRHKHIGFNLFKRAINHIANSCDQITWVALPKSSKMPLNTLCTIYEKMITRLEVPYELTKTSAYNNPPRVKMTLKIMNPEIIFDLKPRHRASENIYWISARLNGEDEIGYVAYKFLRGENPPLVRMSYLGVSPNYRRMGIATILLQKCIDEARKTQSDYLVWDAMSLESTIHLDKLIEIYKAMACKLGFAPEKIHVGTIWGPRCSPKAPISLKIA